MLKNLIPLLLVFVSFQSTSQNYFKGVVAEEDTSMNVTDAIVAVEGTAIAQTTDLNGAFNFTEKIPDGEHVVTITKEGYVTKYLLIDVIFGKNIIMNNIKIEVNKKEKKRREKALKEKEKAEKKARKQREKTIATAQKEKEKRNKELAKKKKKLQKQKAKYKDDDDDNIEYVDNSIPETTPTPVITSLQIKFGVLLNVTPETITNTKLYEFIEDWEGTNYLMGGANKDGIDCSSFTQRLHTKVYDKYIERTAQKQFNAKQTDKFLGKEFLQEGDLMFFNNTGDSNEPITHVGIYLHNNNFVHSTSYTKDTGESGVKISNLENNYWAKKFVAGGRRPK